MSRLKKILAKVLAPLFSDLRSTVLAIVVTSFFAGSGGLLLFVESVRIVVIDTMQKPVPVWAAIAMALIVILYTCLKSRSFQAPPKKKPRVEFFTTKGMKWKVTVYDNDIFEVDETPYCVEHDKQFTTDVGHQYCPGLIGKPCQRELTDRNHFKAISYVKSTVESKLRNGEKLC